MAELFYSSPRARFYDSNAKPLSLGSVTYYYAGTTTLKNIFTDSTEAVQATNPQVLDIEGYVREGGVWLGEGNYKVVLKDSNGNTIWTQDNVKGAPETGTGELSTTFVENIQNMRDLDLEAGRFVYVAGYFSKTDTGGGYFYYDEDNTDADDGGYVINSTGAPASGRYLRISTSNKAYGSEFGISNENTGTINSALTNAQTYVINNSNRKTLVLDSGGALSGNINLTGAYRLEILEGVKFTASSTYTITLSMDDAVCESKTSLVDDTALLDWSPVSKTECYPEWWGVNDAAFNDDRVPLNRITTNSTIVFTGIYSLAPVDAPQLVTVDGCHFKKGCKISLIGAFAANSEFLNVTWDEDAQDVFTAGSYETLRFNQPMGVNLFENVLTDATRYENMLKAVTAQKTKQGGLIWKSLGTSRSIQPTITFTDKSYPIVSEFIDSQIVLTTFLYIGNVINTNEQIISVNNLTCPIITNPEYKLAWIGVKESDDSTTVADNWTTMNKMDAYSNSLSAYDIFPVWDGDNMTVKLNKTWTISSSTGNLKVKNLLVKDSTNVAWSGTSAIIDIDMNTEFDNVSFETDRKDFYLDSSNSIDFTWSNSTYDNGINSTSDPFTINTAGDIKFDNVTLNIVNGTDGCKIGETTQPNDIIIKDSEFNVRLTGLHCAASNLIKITNTDSTEGSIASMSGNTAHIVIKDCTVDATTIGFKLISLTDAPSCDIDGCTTEEGISIYKSTRNGKGYKIRNCNIGGQTLISDTTPNNTNFYDITIQNNIMSDRIYFDGDSVGQATKGNGIVITNNKFNKGSSDTPPSTGKWIQLNNFADVLHYNCLVKDNVGFRTDSLTIGYTNIPSTITNFSISDGSPASGRTNYTIPTSTDIIFPYVAYPMSAKISEESATGSGLGLIDGPPILYSSTGDGTDWGSGRIGINYSGSSGSSISIDVVADWNQSGSIPSISITVS